MALFIPSKWAWSLPGLGGAFPVAQESPARHVDLGEVSVHERAGGGQTDRADQLVKLDLSAQLDQGDIVLILLVSQVSRVDQDFPAKSASVIACL